MFLAYACDENGKSPRKNLSFPEMAQKSESECSFWCASGNIPHDTKECSLRISSLSIKKKTKNENENENENDNNKDYNNNNNSSNSNNSNSNIDNLSNNYNYGYNIKNKSKKNTTNTTSHTTSFSLSVSASRCVRFVTDFGLSPQLVSEMKIRIIVDELIDRRTGTGKGKGIGGLNNHTSSSSPISPTRPLNSSFSPSPSPVLPSHSIPSSPFQFSSLPPTPSPFSPSSSSSPTQSSTYQNKHVQFEPCHLKKNRRTGLHFSEFLEFIAILSLQEKEKTTKRNVFSTTFSKVLASKIFDYSVLFYFIVHY